MSAEGKLKNSKKNQVVHPPSEESENTESSESSQEDEVIELTARDKRKQNKEEKPKVSQKKLDSINKARAIRQDQLRKKREDDEQAKVLIERAYRDELEANLVKTTLPKYSKAIKKQILEKLKAQKLQELKQQYGYKSEDESSSESEDEVVIKKKAKPKKKVAVEKPVAAQKGLLSVMRSYGF